MLLKKRLVFSLIGGRDIVLRDITEQKQMDILYTLNKKKQQEQYI